MRTLVSILIAFLLLSGIAEAQLVQPATLVQQTVTMANAATNVVQSNASATTLTITPPSGQYVYLSGLDITNCAGGTAVSAAAPTFVTSTGWNGPPKWMVGSGVTAGLCTSTGYPAFATPLRSATPGAAVTIVTPTFATNQTVNVNAYYFVGP